MLAYPFILIGAVLVIGMYVLGVYNTLQRLKTQIKASIQEIGNQLKRQASLIPNLQASVKGYMKQEKEIFGMLTDARTSATKASQSGNMVDIEKAIDQIQTMMPKIAVQRLSLIRQLCALCRNSVIQQISSCTREELSLI